MKSDIPECVPEEIAAKINKRWGSIHAAAERSRIPYTKIHSVLVKSPNHRVLETIHALAMACPTPITVHNLAKIFVIESIETREVEIKKLLGKTSLRSWSLSAGLSENAACQCLRNKKSMQLKAIVDVAELLNLDLWTFRQKYKEHLTITA